jgi:hypothetical protein
MGDVPTITWKDGDVFDSIAFLFSMPLSDSRKKANANRPSIGKIYLSNPKRSSENALGKFNYYEGDYLT